jgi:hypothetical protein
VPNLAALEGLVIWPKLFRRIAPYLAAGFVDFDGFDGWLRADPVHRDDALFLLDRHEHGNLHDVARRRPDDPAHRLARGLHHRVRPAPRPPRADRSSRRPSPPATC